MDESNEVMKGEIVGTPEPVGTGSGVFAPWMTVQEAVAYCLSKGLPRTPKTVRKWANRSIESLEGGEISVQRQDTENGFRWLINRESLDVKIEQEKAMAATQSGETDGGANTSEHVSTSAHQFEQVTKACSSGGAFVNLTC